MSMECSSISIYRRRFERTLIEAALEATGGHRGEAARRLGLGRNTLARALIGKYAGDVASFQAPGGEREYEILDVLYR